MSEIFTLFVKTLTPDDKYSRRNMQVFWQQLQTPLSRRGNIIFLFSIDIWNVHEIENIKKKKKSILA